MSLTYVVAYVGRVYLNFITNVTCFLPARFGQEVSYRQSFCSELSRETFSFTNCFDVGNLLKISLGKTFSWENWEDDFQLSGGEIFWIFLEILFGKNVSWEFLDVFENLIWEKLQLGTFGCFFKTLFGKNFSRENWECFLENFVFHIW